MQTHTLAAGALAGALTLFTPLAFAQQGTMDSGGIRPYAGAGAGWLSVDADGLDEDDWGFQLFAGARAGQYFGGELGYVNFGEVEDGGRSLEADGITASVLGFVPLQGLPLRPYARAGALFWEADLSGVAIEDDGTDFFWGVGAEFDVQRELGVRVAWDSYDMDDADADLVSLSAIWQF